MKKSLKHIFLAFVTVLFVSSCNIDKFDENAVVPGRKVTSIKMSITTPAPANVVTTKAMTDETETNIESLAIFFFTDYNAGAANRIYVSGTDFDLSEPTAVTPTNYKYTISLNPDSDKGESTICSGNWYVYAVANWNKGLFSQDLDQLKEMTRAELDDFCIVKTSTAINPSETALLLTGRYGSDNTGLLTLQEGDNTLADNIHLRRITAKIICNFYSGPGVKFDAKRIKIYNYSRSCTLFERSGWQQYDGATSYQYGTFPGSLSKKVATTGVVLSDATNSDYGYEPSQATDSEGNTYYTFTFYMPENIPTPKATPFPENSYIYRDKRVSNTDRNFLYAPDDATYFVVTGEYTGPNFLIDEEDHEVNPDPDGTKQITGDVSYTVHLGNFSAGATNTETKGSFDNFTIRRNSKYVYNVTVNSVSKIIVEAAFNTEENPGAEGNLITTAEGVTNVTLDSHYEQVLMAVPATASFDSYAFLINTPYTKDLMVNKSTSAEVIRDADVYWLKFAKPASDTALQEYKDAIVVDEDNSKYGLGTIFDLLADLQAGSGKYYITSGGNRYIAVYVDEYYYDTDDIKGDIKDVSLEKFINVDNRSLLLATSVSISSDKHSIFTQNPIFTINQRSIKTPYVLSVTNPFGIESLEETSESATYGKEVGTNTANGWSNFAAGVCDADNTTLWSTYVNDAANCHVINAEVTDASLTTLGLNGAYQCLSRNRDLDGDGYIDAAEIKWFLPAMEQTDVFWYGSPFFSNAEYPVHTRYWNSYRTRYIWWALEGTTYGDSMPTDATAQARCIRALKNVTAETSRVWSSSTNADGNLVIAIDGLNDLASNPDTQIGEYLPHEVGDPQSDVLPQKFMYAKNYLSAPTGNPIYSEGTVVDLDTLIVNYDPAGTAFVNEIEVDPDSEGLRIQINLDSLSASQPALGNIISIGSDISLWFGEVAHFYYPVSLTDTSVLLEITSSSARTGHHTITRPTDSILDIIYKNGTVIVEGESYELPTTGLTTLQYGSKEGSNRSYCKINYVNHVEFQNSEIIGYETDSLFTRAQITDENLCANYYSEAADQSDLGDWRIPNEKEFSLIYQVYIDEISGGSTSTLMKAEQSPLTGLGARTKFERKESSGYTVDPGMSFFYMNYNNNLTTALDGIPTNFYVRCVRDSE